ncbi:MAG: hypothetical protein J3R72DRAFT_435800 [Linnemannia gamsii]|nr:MAG: hypothetical protein J3R72DRAFT_435800 [Linnemannia gamsii]
MQHAVSFFALSFVLCPFCSFFFEANYIHPLGFNCRMQLKIEIRFPGEEPRRMAIKPRWAGLCAPGGTFAVIGALFFIFLCCNKS